MASTSSEGRPESGHPARSSPRRTPSATVPAICWARSCWRTLSLLATGGIVCIQARWIANSSGELAKMLILSQVRASSWSTAAEPVAITAR
jgi:hypothetical protein